MLSRTLFFSALLLSAAVRAEPTPPQPATPPAANAPGAMSESKFISALYAEITKNTPEKSPAGAGEVTASFHVNAAGKIDKVTIDKTTSPALAEEVKKILASVSAPPPPGGGMDIGQTFRFNDSEEKANAPDSAPKPAGARPTKAQPSKAK